MNLAERIKRDHIAKQLKIRRGPVDPARLSAGRSGNTMTDTGSFSLMTLLCP